MKPSSSSRLTRRWQGVGDRPTLSARSTIGSRPSACNAAMIFLSISSRVAILTLQWPVPGD